MSLLAIKDVAAQLAVSESTVKKWLRVGKLRFVKIGRLSRIQQADVDTLVATLQPAKKAE